METRLEVIVRDLEYRKGRLKLLKNHLEVNIIPKIESYEENKATTHFRYSELVETKIDIENQIFEYEKEVIPFLESVINDLKGKAQ